MINQYIAYDFFQRALIVGFLISVCSALLGVSLVLKRCSMIGDGLSHVGFGALALAAAFNLTPLYIAIPSVIIAAFVLIRISESSIKGDAAISLIASSALAIGIVAISVTSGMNIDVNNYMFGSIISLTKTDMHLTIVSAVVIILAYIVMYNKLFLVTFDEQFATATGIKSSRYNTILAIMTAITVVLGMRMMGALLISSLIVFPAVISMLLFKKNASVVISSVCISVFCFFTGMILSVICSTPSGATIVLVNLFLFILTWVYKLIKR